MFTKATRAAVLTGAAMVAGVAAAAGYTATTATPASAATGQVAYVRGGAIYVLTDGVEKRLTEDNVNARPRFSADRAWLAYLHNNTAWVMRADGSAKRQVSDRPAGGPSFSPDGKWIAYASESCTGGPGVYRVSATRPGAPSEVVFPESCKDQPLPEVFTISGTTAESAPASLAERLSTDVAVAWSPDGTKIAFPGGECESIADKCLSVGTVATGREYAVDVYGGGGTGTDGFGVVPAWSPDGRKLSWTAYAEGAKPVHVQESDVTGANKRQVGRAEDRELVYTGSRTALVTATVAGKSQVVRVDLVTGARTVVVRGSQPTA